MNLINLLEKKRYLEEHTTVEIKDHEKRMRKISQGIQRKENIRLQLLTAESMIKLAEEAMKRDEEEKELQEKLNASAENISRMIREGNIAAAQEELLHLSEDTARGKRIMPGPTAEKGTLTHRKPAERKPEISPEEKEWLLSKMPNEEYKNSLRALMENEKVDLSDHIHHKRFDSLWLSAIDAQMKLNEYLRLGKTGFGVRKWAHRSKDLSQQDNNSYYLVRYL